MFIYLVRYLACFSTLRHAPLFNAGESGC